MTPTKHRNPIGALNPINDDDALDAVSPQTWADLAAAIVATPSSPPRRPRLRDARAQPRRPTLRLTVAAGAVTAVLVGVIGLLSGQGPSSAQPADAAILRGTAAALHPSGAIVIETWSSVSRYPRGYTLRPGLDTARGDWSRITETPTGSGPQNELVLDMGASAITGVQSGYVNGDNELYDPIHHIAYDSSNYGPDITPGTRPGTYVYTMPRHAMFFRLPSVVTPPGPDAPPPLTITAKQAQALRDGRAEVWVGPNSHYQNRMSIHAASRVPSESVVVHAWLGKLKVVGRTTVDGRRAIKLVPVHGSGEYDVAPGTFYPIREVVRYPSGAGVITTWSEYRVIPAIPANERLLSLAARHPGARVDHSRADFLAAWKRLMRGD
ncbi:MAG: hypothetical protein M3065_22635 [Actinomycetota bacterium]|nr:hypothetical protein [Actinomycetota bacterium]